MEGNYTYCIMHLMKIYTLHVARIVELLWFIRAVKQQQ